MSAPFVLTQGDWRNASLIHHVASQGQFRLLLYDNVIRGFCADNGIPCHDLEDCRGAGGEWSVARPPDGPWRLVFGRGVRRRLPLDPEPFLAELFADDEPAMRENPGELMALADALAGALALFPLHLVTVLDEAVPKGRLLVRLAQKLGLPTLYLAHGAYGIGGYDLPAGSPHARIHADRVAVFGEVSRDLYRRSGAEVERAVVTGSAEWDKFHFLKGRLDRSWIRELGLDPARPVVLYGCTYSADPVLAAPIKECYRQFLASMVALQAEIPVQVIVKPHYNGYIPHGCWTFHEHRELAEAAGLADFAIAPIAFNLNRGRLSPALPFSITNTEFILGATDVAVVASTSSLAAETVLMGVPTVIAGRYSYDPPYAGPDYGGMVNVPSDQRADLGERVRELLQDTPRRAQVREALPRTARYLNEGVDGKARERIHALMLDLAARMRFTQPPVIREHGTEHPLHVLFLMHGWEDEGGGTLLPRMAARALARAGHRVSVIYTAAAERPEAPPYHVEKRREEGVELLGIYNRPCLFVDPQHPELETEDPVMCGLLGELLDTIRPDIVHFHSFAGFTLAAARETARRGLPSLASVHNFWPFCPRLYLLQADLTACEGPSEDGVKCATCCGVPEKAPLYGKRLESARDMALRRVGRLLAPSARTADLLASWGVPPARVSYLPQFPPSVADTWRETGASRLPAGPLDRPLRVGFIGFLLPMKGVHLLVRALQGFPPSRVELHIHGGGIPDYRAHLEEADTARVVRFHGAYDPADLPRILSGLDVVVVPSIWDECQGMVVSEALAARCPVVVSRMGGLPDPVKEGETGLVVPAREIPALARAIVTFLDNPLQLDRMQRAIQLPGSFETYLEDLVTHYRELTAAPPAPEPLPEAAPALRATRPPSVRWEGAQRVHSSLALINREVCLRLLEAGCDLQLIPSEPGVFSPLPGTPMARLASREDALPGRPTDVHVRHTWPPVLEPPAEGKWAVIQPWEFGPVPRAWVPAFSRRIHELWVPSGHVRDGFLRSGIPAAKVVVIPNGVDTLRFTPRARAHRLSTRKSFRFLFVGGTIWRKGPDILLEAYRRAFSAADDVCLVIKDMGSQSFYQGQTAEESIRAWQKDPGAPELLHMTGDLPPEELPGLYTACHCLVHPYRAEGFGLPIAEAMACGLPVVVTGAGACLEFCDASCACLVPATLHRHTRREVGGLETTAPPEWFEPDVGAVAGAMRHIFEHRSEALSLGLAGMRRIHGNFRFDQMAHRILERIVALAGLELPVPSPVDPRLDDLRGRGRLEEAEALVRAELGTHPEGPELWNVLGEIRLERGEAPSAETVLRTALAQDPLHRGVRNNLAVSLLLQRRFPEARQILTDLLLEDPTDATARDNLSAMERDAGRRN